MADASGLSRAYVQRLIADGRLTATGRAGQAQHVLAPGTQPGARRPRPGRARRPRPRTSRCDVVYEDADVLIVDKPAGLVTHPAPGHSTRHPRQRAAGAAAAAEAYGTVAGVDRPGIVHRLDRDTSGLLMVARNDRAQAALLAQLKARRVQKTYLALVAGVDRRPRSAASRRPSAATRAIAFAHGRHARAAARP